MKETAKHEKESFFGDAFRIMSLEKAWSAAKLGGAGAAIGFFGTALFALAIFRSQQNSFMGAETAVDYQLMMVFAVVCLGLWIFWGWRMYSGKGLYSAVFALLFVSCEVAWTIISSGGSKLAIGEMAVCYCFIASFRGNLFLRRCR